MKSTAIVMAVVSFIGLPLAYAGGIPSFAVSRERTFYVGEGAGYNGGSAEPFVLNGQLMARGNEVILRIVVPGLPETTYRNTSTGYEDLVPHLVEVRRYVQGIPKAAMPLLRVLWDFDGDGVSDGAAEVMEYRDGKPVFGPSTIVRLPMATTWNFVVPQRTDA